MSWDDITRSQQYQEADDYNKEVMRNSFIQNTVNQYGMNEQQAEQFRTEFDRYTAPRGNVYSEWDSLKSIGSGALSATADLAQAATLGTPNALSKSIRGYADDMAMDRRPSTIEAVESFGFGEGQEITGEGLLYGGLSGIGSMAPMLAGGGLLGKGIQYGGKAISGYGKAKKALEAADNVTDATAAAGRLAKLDKNIDRASSVLGYGTVGGAMVGGGAGNQTYQEVMALDDQTLLKSKEFQKHYRQTYQESPENRRQAFDKAKAMLAEELAAGATAKAGGIGLASMAVLGPQLQKIVTGKGPQGIFKGGAAGAGTEGVQELFEGGGQQWATNTELADIDGRSQWQDVGNVAATGAVLGMASGGPMGAFGGALKRGEQPQTQEQLVEAFTVNQTIMASAEQEIAQFDQDIAVATETLANVNENLRFLKMQRQQAGVDPAFIDKQIAENTAEKEQATATLEGKTQQKAGAINDIRKLAMANAGIQQQLKQPKTQPEQPKTETNTGQQQTQQPVDPNAPLDYNPQPVTPTQQTEYDYQNPIEYQPEGVKQNFQLGDNQSYPYDNSIEYDRTNQLAESVEQATKPKPTPTNNAPLQLEDMRRTFIDSAGNAADNMQAINQQARTDRETAASQNHPGYAYQGDDNDLLLYHDKARQLNKLMKRFEGDPRDKESFKEFKQLIQETKRLERSAMEQAKARRKPIATVNRVSLLQQARAALESKRLDEFNNLMSDIRQTNLEEQQRLSGQDSANNTAYDSRLSNQQYRDYLQMTAEEVQAQEQLDRARAQAAKGKGGQIQADDTLLTAIGRLGGLRTDTVEDTVGESIKYWAKNEGKGLSGRFLNKNGLTLDDMGRILNDYGYYDQNGQEYGANSLTDAITEEVAGRPRFSQAMGDYSQVAQQQSLRAASGASNVTAPAVRAALAGEPLSPAYRQEVSRILDEAESDPYFDRPEFLSQQAADIEQSRQDNAVTDDWYDNFEQVDIVYAEGRTGLDSDTFNEADWEGIEAEARELSILADAAANEQNNQVESDEADPYQRTNARVRYGDGRRPPEATGQRAETEGTTAAEQRGSNPQEVSEQPPQFDLTTQTEQELQQQASQQKAAEAEQRQQEEQARQKAEADRERKDFELSGSNSISDQAAARGQADILGANSKPSESEPNPEPTEAQKQAGNYKKEHIKLQGLDISLENKRGYTRSGTDPDGNEWSVTMAHDYGYIKRTEGADGDQLDVFIGENPDSDQVFIVDQVNKDGSFDEHKVMLGFVDRESAIDGYKANYQKGWKVGEVTQLTIGDFKNWLKNGDTTKPTSKQQIEVKELSSKVDDDTLNSEYHYKAAQDAFQHSSRNAPQSYREGFTKTVKEVYQAGLEKAETDQQKAALDKAIQQFKADYLEAEKAYFAVREGTVSVNIAGRSKFNSKLAEKRGNADDRALEKLNNQINALKPDVARAVSDARTPEQKQRDNEAAAAKRKKDEIEKHTLEAARYVGEVANAMRDRMEAVAKGNRQTFMPKAFEAIQKAMEIDRAETIKALEIMNKAAKDVGGLLKVVGARSKLGKLYRDIQAEQENTSAPEQETGTNDNILLRSNGQPFSSQRAAKASKQFKSNPGAEVVEVKGGYGVNVDTKAENLNTSEQRVKETAESIQDATESTVQDWSNTTADDFMELSKQALRGELKEVDYKAAALAALDNEQRLMEELGRKTKPQLIEMIGGYSGARLKNEKKDRAVWQAYDTILSRFAIGNISWSYGESRNEGYRENFNNITQAMIDKEAEAVRERTEQQKARMGEAVKAITNPETLAEFRQFIEIRGFDKLTDQQRATYDRLAAEEQIAKQPKQPTVKEGFQTDDQVELGEPEEGTHGKTGDTIYNVQVISRLGKDKFKEAAAFARSMKGGYWRGNFYFNTQEDAETFTNWMKGESVDLSEKQEAKQAEKQANTADKLKAMADRIEEDGKAIISADRRENTLRQMSQAEYSRKAGENNIRFANILRAIADSDSVVLKGLTQKVQVELLAKLANTLKYRANSNRSEHELTYIDRAGNTQFKDEVTPEQQVKFARMPLETMYASSMKELAHRMIKTKGYTLAGRSLLKSANRFEDHKEIAINNKSKNFDKMVEFIRLHEDRYSTFKGMQEDYSRLQRMGITTSETLRTALIDYMSVAEQAERGGPARSRLDEMTSNLKRTVLGNRNAFNDFFPTPENSAEEVIGLLDIQPGMDTLEPSGGHGMLADQMRTAGANVDVVEMAGQLREILKEKGYDLVGSDFTEFKTDKRYDRIGMNPPFSNDQDILHTQLAYDLLKPGGRMVSIVSSMAGDRQNKNNQNFRKWLDDLNAEEQLLPEDAFKSSFNPTGVRTKVIVINKPESGSDSTNRYKISKADTVPTGIKSATAGKVAIELSEQLGVTVNAVTDESQLPKHVQEQMQADGVTRIKGVFDKCTGQAWIVSSNLNDEAEAIRTVLHEVAGHQALTQMLGKTMDSIMARIHNDMPQAERQRIERAYSSQLSGMDAATRKAVIAEEWLAHLAETNPTSSTLKRFVSKVRYALRKLFKNIKWTQDDVTELLESARNKLKDNGPQGPKGGKRTESSTNRYSLAAAAKQNSLPDDIQEVMKKVHGGLTQQVGIVDRVKSWLNDMELASKDTWKAIGDKFYTGVIDQFDPIARMEKGVNDGKLKEAKDSAYKATLRTKNLDGIMTAVLGKGTPELKDGSVVVRSGSKGLLEVFEPLAKAGNMELWETWAAARRAQRLLNEGRENLFDQADIDSINRHVNARPELKRQFEEAHKQYQAFNKQILDFAQESGLIDPESRKLWETDDYLPFHRVNPLDDNTQSSLLRRKGLSNQQSGIRTLEGGVGRISPLEAIYRNTASLIDASMKNIAMQRITDVGVAAGAMEKTSGGIRLTMEQVKERLVAKGILDEKDTLTQEQKKRWEALLIKFEDMGEGSVKVSRDGKTEVYHVKEGNEDLLETMQAMGPDTLHGILKVFAMPKRLLTSMVTADPGFMARNFVRDTLSTWMTVHPEIGGKTLHASMVEAVKNVKKGLESDDHWALMMAGGGSGGFYEITPENVRGKLTPGQYKAHHRRVMDNIEQSWQWWQKFGSRFENANRLAVFSAAIDNGASIAEAAHQAQDVLNFTKRGKWQSMRILTEIIPFLNARVQGLDRLGRGLKDNPSAMLLRGSMYMAASMALWAMFADDDRYKELPEHEKLTWHHIWMPDGNHIRIPKPFEMGAIFATLPEVFNNVAFNGEDGEWAAKMIGKMFTDVFAMGMPQVIAPALDVAKNRSSFTDAPILSLGMQYQMPESQYTPWTSETMKALAEAMPDGAPDWMRSPKRLEYLLRGYFGTLGSYALMASDALAREVRDAPDRPEWSIRQYPVIGSFIRGDDEGATRYSTEMYELLSESNALASTIKKYTEQGRLEEAAELDQEGREALDSRKELNRYSRQISKLKKEVRRILDSRFMTASLKKQRIDRLNGQINDLYEEAVREAGY